MEIPHFAVGKESAALALIRHFGSLKGLARVQLVGETDREGITDLVLSNENNCEIFDRRFCRQVWLSELRPYQ
jgi:hypothetical protein